MSQSSPPIPMSESARSFLSRIGRRFGSREVLAQAEATLVAQERFSAELRLHGFGDADASLLAAARAAAAERAGGRSVGTDRAYVLALDDAKTSRARARSVLTSAYRRLRGAGGPLAEGAMPVIAAALTATSEPGGDDRDYAASIDLLVQTLEEPAIREAVADCGGPEAAAKLRRARSTLREVDEAAAPSEDPELDALFGLLVELCRTAHFAAQSASKEVGQRAIAWEFRLRLLAKPEGRDE